MSSLPRLVIGIPTFRRPRQLEGLLDSLRPELAGTDALVVVADNDVSPQTPQIVSGSGLDAVCVGVPERGISQARNALIREAFARRPGWTWLTMVDDDGVVEPGWLAALGGCAARFEADIISGPVLRDLPPQASIVARNSMFSARPRQADGPVEVIRGAQNMTLSRRLVDLMTDPWFDPELGIIGGEDHNFFQRAQLCGARFVWCDSAMVTEATPPERLATRAILRRAYRSNLIAAQSDVKALGRTEVANEVGRGVARTTRNAAAALARRDADRLVQAGISVVSLGGRVVGMMSTRRPTQTHGI